jgi:drug/metabolite transporter (DMT)-like permease
MLAPPLWRDVAIAAFFNMTIFQIGMIYGIYLMSAGRTAVLVYTMPIWVTLFARLLLGERLTWPKIAGLCLGLVGIAALLSQNLSSLRNAPLGAALTLVAAMSFGFGTVWMKRQRWAADLAVVAGWQVLLGAVPLIAVWAFIDLRTDLRAVSLSSWGALLYLALIANSLAYVAWFRVIRAFSATVSGLGTLAVPCIGVVSSALILHEALTVADLVALALIGSALVAVLAEQRFTAPRAAAALAGER